MDLSTIVKAYDVRGIVPDQLDEPIARALGAAFVDVTGAERIVTAHDMRESGPGLARAFAEGALHRGASVVEAGLGSTDMLYFASGHLDLPGAMFTASHNPAQYNGIKMCRAGAVADRPGHRAGRDPRPRRGATSPTGCRAAAGRRAPSSRSTCSPRTPSTCAGWSTCRGIRPLKVVVDAGNGMGGYTVPAVLGDAVLPALPLTIVPLYFELDGTFPNHEANPLEPANLVDLQRAVVASGADIGLAFDGDADRCFVVDARGRRGLAAARSPRWSPCASWPRRPGATVIHNLITSHAVPEVDPRARRRAGAHPGRPLLHQGRDGRARNAVFGGEHSAHYYFRDFWFADTGMLAAMHVLAALGEQPGTLAELTAQYDRYAASGEINSTVDDQPAGVDGDPRRVRRRGAAIDELDGLTVELPDGSWFNVRASNTEPLLRLNVEARTRPAMARCATRCSPSSAAEPTAMHDRIGATCRSTPTCSSCSPARATTTRRCARRRGGADVLVCTLCASTFPIADGIPVLLLDEATPGPNGLGNGRLSARMLDPMFDEALLDDAELLRAPRRAAAALDAGHRRRAGAAGGRTARRLRRRAAARRPAARPAGGHRRAAVGRAAAGHPAQLRGDAGAGLARRRAAALGRPGRRAADRLRSTAGTRGWPSSPSRARGAAWRWRSSRRPARRSPRPPAGRRCTSCRPT